MSGYEHDKLLDSISSKILDYDGDWDSSYAVAEAILDEVFRTLETVTPEMERADMDLGGYGYGDACYEADPKEVYLAMLRASPLAKPKENAP